MSIYSRSCRLFLSVLMLVFATTAAAKDKLPETTTEGLVLQHDTKMAVVYMRPGASLVEYDKIALLKAYVAFKKNWVKEHNRDENFDQQLRDRDVKRIRSEMAEEFNKIFTEVLATKGGHEMVTAAKMNLGGEKIKKDAKLSLKDVRKVLDKAATDGAHSLHEALH